MLRFRNANLYGSDFAFHRSDFAVEAGVFTEIGAQPQGEDLKGALVIPGLVDIHNHGNSGEDFSEGSYPGLVTMARYLAQNGITSFAPASMTVGEETLAAAYACANRLHREQPAGAAVLRGIHMEGPFFSFRKKGAQNPAFLRDPDFAMFLRLNEAAGGLIRIADVAPELPGAMEYIRQVSSICTVSLAHTDADYETAREAFARGASHVTHLYNAMPAMLHREPGVIGAASEQPAVTAELICDGKHVHPSAVRAAFRLFGAERICLISDALSACGMAEGAYWLGGQRVTVKDELARLADGTIAGAASNLFMGLQKAVRFGIPLADAVRAATWNPAGVIGAQAAVGSIAPGKRGDFLVLDDSLNLSAVYLGGLRIK